MSTAAKQKAKAAGIRLDDDGMDTPSEPVMPRTAPGQLIGLQGRVHSQRWNSALPANSRWISFTRSRADADVLRLQSTQSLKRT
jgi:hypothetical protein